MSRYVTRRPWWYPKIIWGASLDGASYVFSIRLPKRYSFYFYWEGPCHKRGTTSKLLSKMCLFNSVVFLKQPFSSVWKITALKSDMNMIVSCCSEQLILKLFGVSRQEMSQFVCVAPTNQVKDYSSSLHCFSAIENGEGGWFTQKWHGGRGTMSGDNVDREPQQGFQVYNMLQTFFMNQ